jgi:hypothetical protein
VLDVARWSSHWAFDGYEPWLLRLAAHPMSSPHELQSILGTDVSFVAQATKLKAGLDVHDVDGSYVDLCARGTIPTRPDNVHDLMNALVWARFPRAKHALCVRQVALARARRIDEGPRLRSREQDSCAMIDEGGMLLGPTRRAIFGHAALEDAISGRDLRPFLVHLETDDLDDALAHLLANPQPIPRVRERHIVLGANEPA